MALLPPAHGRPGSWRRGHRGFPTGVHGGRGPRRRLGVRRHAAPSRNGSDCGEPMTTTRPNPDSVRARLDEAVRFGLRQAEGHRLARRTVPLASRALVLDANILRGEIGYAARRGHDTALVTLA